jgi:hypothetical protein
MVRFSRSMFSYCFVAGALLCVGISACSGGTGGRSAQTPTTANVVRSHTPLDLFGHPIPVSGPHGNISSHKPSAVVIPAVGRHGLSRSKTAVVTTAAEQQTFGVAMSGTDPEGVWSTAVSFIGTASTSLVLPEPSTGTNTLISPDTVVGSDSCIEVQTVYFRNAGDASTTAQLDVYDTCTMTEYNIATIDSTFAATYENSGSLRRALAQSTRFTRRRLVPTNKKTPEARGRYYSSTT